MVLVSRPSGRIPSSRIMERVSALSAPSKASPTSFAV